MRVIFMGTPDFSVGILSGLVKAGHEVCLVVTQPDKPKGRGNALQFPPVKEEALALGLEVFQPKRVREAEQIAHLREKEPEIIVVAAFGQILPKELLELPRYGCINVHASLLPKYRGASPIQWAVLDGEKESGVTIMQMDEGLDTGAILAQKKIPLAPDETAGTLFDKLSALGTSLLIETLPRIEGGTIIPTPQEDTKSTHTAKIEKGMGKIDWSRSAEELERWVRGLSPWPSAYTFLNGKTLKVWRAEVSSEAGALPAVPGAVLAEKDALLVRTGDGILKITELQLEGKKRMEAGTFLRGFHIAPGERLG